MKSIAIIATCAALAGCNSTNDQLLLATLAPAAPLAATDACSHVARKPASLKLCVDIAAALIDYAQTRAAQPKP